MAERSQPKHDWKGRRLKHARPPKGLAAHDLDIDLPDDLFTFESTSDVEPLDEIIGQNRAMEALDVGLGITQEGYNIFVAGLTGTGKMGTIRRSLEVRTEGAVVPPDWVFVNNFDEPDRPWAISLKAGCGRKLQKHMQEFVDRLQDILPKAFRQEDFSQEKERLSETYHKRFQERLDELDAKAREHNFTIR
ncbi:MAG: AAA family ATPase, partial [Candidatus Pacebacteria bacterium]|nr:AAA family ATPase [Candidatus Paceibacterota bacterium]